MFDADVNYLAVILAAAVAQPLGFLWYGPLFGQAWMRARGYTEQDIEGGGGAVFFVVPVLASLVIAYTLARLVDMVGADSVGDCIAVAAFVWAGFMGTATAMQLTFSPKASNKLGLFAIEGGFYLAMALVAGAIIGAFQ